MKKAPAQKHRRLSLTAQVNILIILITLSVSLLVVVFNINNYHKAILDPFERRLAELEIEEDTLTPYLEYFAGFFGTEEMRKARASIGTEDDSFVDWLDQIPSLTGDDPEYGRQSLLLDTTAFVRKSSRMGSFTGHPITRKKRAVSPVLMTSAVKKLFSISRRRPIRPPFWYTWSRIICSCAVWFSTWTAAKAVSGWCTIRQGRFRNYRAFC